MFSVPRFWFSCVVLIFGPLGGKPQVVLIFGVVLSLGPVLILGGGGLHCFALFCYIVCYVLSCASKFRCASAGSGVLRCVVRCAASMRRDGRGYPSRATLRVGAESGYTLKCLDRAAHPLAGPNPSPWGLPTRFVR